MRMNRLLAPALATLAVLVPALAAAQAADLSHVQFTPADVHFMQDMIGHHAQAVEMVALIADRTARDEMRLLGKRIALSQSDEIALMRQWLEARGQAAPSEHAHHLPGAKLMPGMLSADQMERLAASKGAEFDRLFLEGMITHHSGALTMVRELLATPGAGQDVELFSFTADVDADQRMEIDRMSAMLAMFAQGEGPTAPATKEPSGSAR